MEEAEARAQHRQEENQQEKKKIRRGPVAQVFRLLAARARGAVSIRTGTQQQ